jgi:hypothetical protein
VLGREGIADSFKKRRLNSDLPQILHRDGDERVGR